MLEIVYKRDNILKTKKPIIDSIFSGNSDILVFGINKYTESIIRFLRRKNIKVTGIIDDFTNLKTLFDIEILSSNQIDANCIVISSIIEGRPKTVKKILESKGIKKILDYFDLNYLYPDNFPIPFNQNNYIMIKENISKLRFVYSKLEDNLSKKLFEDVIDFRINFNYWDKSFRFLPEQQYFEKFYDFNKIFVMIDAGGFDGETTLNAFKKFKNLYKVFFIEPFPESLKIAKQNLGGIENKKIIYFEAAVSDKDSLKFITTDKGSANHLTKSGGQQIRVARMDDLIEENIDFIKLDIEGEELSALIGGKNLIKRYKPFIACCVYHNQNHFWQIPIYLLNINPKYKIYFRHYTEGIYESVMYFV